MYAGINQATEHAAFKGDFNLSCAIENVSRFNFHVNEDIQTYIRSRLHENRKFNRLSEKLKIELENALMKETKEM